LNPLLALGPIGMIVVGLASIAYWRVRGRPSLKFFLWGGVAPRSSNKARHGLNNDPSP
jgi:hypothetical protein